MTLTDPKSVDDYLARIRESLLAALADGRRVWACTQPSCRWHRQDHHNGGGDYSALSGTGAVSIEFHVSAAAGDPGKSPDVLP